MLTPLFFQDGSIVEYPDIMFKVTYQIPYGDATVPKPMRTDSKVISLDDYPILQQQFGSQSDGSYYMTTQVGFQLFFEFVRFINLNNVNINTCL